MKVSMKRYNSLASTRWRRRLHNMHDKGPHEMGSNGLLQGRLVIINGIPLYYLGTRHRYEC